MMGMKNAEEDATSPEQRDGRMLKWKQMQGTIDLSVWQQDLSVGYLKLSRSSDSYSAKTCEFLQCNDYTKEEDFL